MFRSLRLASWSVENQALRLELLPYARYIQKNLGRGDLLTDALEDLVTSDPPTAIKEHLGEALSHKSVPERFSEVLSNLSATATLRAEGEFLAILADAVKYDDNTETIHALERFYETNLHWGQTRQQLDKTTRLPRLIHKILGLSALALPLAAVIGLVCRACCDRNPK